MTCRHCDLDLRDGCECRPCKWCKRTLHECHEPVDARFPQRAQDAYTANGMATAATCDRGKTEEMRLTSGYLRLGWNIDRAVGNPEWVGLVPDGVDPDIVNNRRTRARAQR